MKQFRDTPYYVTEDGKVYKYWPRVETYYPESSRSQPYIREEKYKQLKPQKHNGGYLMVGLYFGDGKVSRKYLLIHRLVAECYLGKCPEGMEEKVEEEKMEIEDVVKAIVAEVKDEMGKLRDEMKAIEDKVSKMEAAPAAEPTRTSTGRKMGATGRGFKAFNVEESLNADRIKMALNELKSKKK